jgi:hypothetical protein
MWLGSKASLMNARAGLLLALSIVAPLSVRAAEFQVHTTVVLDQEHVAVTQLSSGMVIFAWEDESAGESQIRFRRYDSNLVSLGSATLAQGGTTNDQVEPVIAPRANGFVLAWASRNLDGSDYGIAYRRFDSSGNPLDATVLQANTTTANAQLRPQIAALSSGGFVIAWSDQSGAYQAGAEQDIRYRRFNGAGTPLDANDLVANAWGVDAHIGGDQANPSVAALPNGGFVIGYEDRLLEDVFAVRFDGLGNPLQVPGAASGSRQMRLNQTTAFEQSMPSLSSFTNGAFVAVFNSETNGTAASRRVKARVFDPNGSGANEFVVGSFTNSTQDARVAALPNGHFIVTLQALNVGPDAPLNFSSVLAQRFTTNGAALSPSFIANTYNAGDQDRPGLTALRDGSYLLAWQSLGQDGNGYGVFAERYTNLGEGAGRLLIARQNPAGTNFLVTFTNGAPYVTYRLQAATNLASWTTLRTTNTPNGAFQYLETQGGTVRARSYRVVTP